MKIFFLALILAVGGNASVQDFVRMFNAADRTAIAAYLQTNVAPAPPGMGPGATTAQDVLQLRSAIGPVTVGDVKETPRSIQAAVHAKGGWYTFSFMKVPPGSGSQPFVDISLDLGVPPRAPGQSVPAYVSQVATEGYFSGEVLLAQPGAPFFTAAYGMADRARHTANTTGTLFNVASIGKLFTTAAVYQLIEGGKLHLSDTIGQWLPDYPNTDAKAATVQQLLDMSSGIGDIFTRKFMRGDHAHIRSLQDYLPFFAADPLLFAPGKGNAYSNGGFIVLGLIVEKASGENFYDYVQRHVFAPAGMTHSAYLTLDQPANRAIGYTRAFAPVATWSTPLRDGSRGEPGRGSSAGGAFSTAADLYKFAKACRDGTLVKGKYMWNGSGAWLGGTPGWNAVLSVKDNGVIAIALANQDPPAARSLVSNF